MRSAAIGESEVLWDMGRIDDGRVAHLISVGNGDESKSFWKIRDCCVGDWIDLVIIDSVAK